MTVVPVPIKLDLSAEHTPYFAKDGTRLVGVTTIQGVLAKPSLYSWYATQEREGIRNILENDALFWSDIQAKLPRYKNGNIQPFAEIKRDKAADVGTITHARIEAWLKGTTLDPEGIPADAYAQSIHGLNRFIEFWERERLTLIASERVMVSEIMRVGGTADVIAAVDNLRILVDIKTNAGNRSWPYAEHISQASTYAAMALELDGVAIDQVWLVRVGKDPDDRTQVVKLTDKQRMAGTDLFHGALRCYNAKKVLE